MPSPFRNGEFPPPAAGRGGVAPYHHFPSAAAEQKLRRINALVLLLRSAAFCFSLASAVFMAANSSPSPSPSWLDFDVFRFVLAANAIVAVYSFFEMGVSTWEILRGGTLLPEPLQLWFDFGHDQIFAYLLLSAEAAGAGGLRRGRTCDGDGAFCLQAVISVALGFVGFAFLAVSAVVSGFRVACFTITGSRFHL